MAGSFYDRIAADAYRANAATAGPWDARLQHGGPPAALLGRALETDRKPDRARIARIAFDFYGPVPVAEVSIETDVLRPGAKIQLSIATLHAGGRIAMRATAWYVRVEADRSPPVPWPYVVPALPPAGSEARFPKMGRFGYGDSLEWRFVRGGFGELGPAVVWTRCRIPLVQGETLTALDRVLIPVDSANGISTELPFTEWTFVPIDLVVVLTRLPAKDWVGLDARTAMGNEGIGCTDTLLFDEAGVFGRALQTLYIAPR